MCLVLMHQRRGCPGFVLNHSSADVLVNHTPSMVAQAEQAGLSCSLVGNLESALREPAFLDMANS